MLCIASRRLLCVASLDRLVLVCYVSCCYAVLILFMFTTGADCVCFFLSSGDLSNWCSSVLLIILCLVFGFTMFCFVFVLRICMLIRLLAQIPISAVRVTKADRGSRMKCRGRNTKTATDRLSYGTVLPALIPRAELTIRPTEYTLRPYRRFTLYQF
jgi:hypothetical protein